MSTLIGLESDWLYYGNVRIANSGHIGIERGVTTVIGPNGAGKSTLASVLERGHNFRTNRLTFPSGDINVQTVEFADIHSLGSTAASYYQQRYEAAMNDEIPTVADALGPMISDPAFTAWAGCLGLYGIVEKRINYLSSGELRKLLIARALTSRPDLLILDNPYIGLDAESRGVMDDAIQKLPGAGVNVIMIVCDPADIPSYTDTVIPMTGMSILSPVKADRPIEHVRAAMTRYFDYAIDMNRLPRPLRYDNEPVDIIAGLHGCRVDYNGHVVIDSLDWTVRDGENWALAGPNGSGKSTLLSLITADHPRAYNNDITLFDRRRGSGESIWDIKRRIGYVSAEMRLYFNADVTVETVIARGFNDTAGNYSRPAPEHTSQARQWIGMLHMEDYADRRFSSLSAGERQLALIARALIKQPRLVILDEPMHGLDYARKRAVRALINHLAARAAVPGTRHPMTLIYVTHYADEIPECITRTKTLPRRTQQ